MNITYSHSIGGEPVFTGSINNKPFKVLFVLSDIDYGWTFLDYLPDITEQEAGTDQLDDLEQEEVLDYLSDYTCRTIFQLEAAE